MLFYLVFFKALYTEYYMIGGYFMVSKKYVVSYMNILTKEMKDAVASRLPDNYILQSLEESSLQEKKNKIMNADYVLVGDETMEREVIEHAKKLRVIQKLGSGYDRIDIKSAREKGIPVAIVPGQNAISVAEHTFLLALSVLRRLLFGDSELRNGNWQKNAMRFSTYELNGKVLGLIGMGHIGRAVAKIALGFNMSIVYYDKVKIPKKIEEELGTVKLELEELLKKSDIISIHVPSLTETKDFISEKEFKIMKNSSILINTSRGNIVNECALISALENFQIRGAGIDVFSQEPPKPTNKLLKLNNVVVTPHMGGVTYDAYIRILEIGLKNIFRHASGSKLPENIVVN